MEKNLSYKKNTVKQIDIENLLKNAYIFCLNTKNIASLLDFNNKKNIAFEAWNEDELVSVIVLNHNFEIKLFATITNNLENSEVKKLLDFAKVHAFKFNANFLTITVNNVVNYFYDFLYKNGFTESNNNVGKYEFDVGKINKNPKLTICTMTYQHAEYISETIESFLSQVTDFIYEIIIHEDCSPDGTGDIVKEYAKKYPRLFTAIIQKQNQYSKGISIWRTFIWPIAKGKYTAICDGDDYWIDDFKIQNQVDFLENNPDYGLVHSSYVEWQEKTKAARKNHQFRLGLPETDHDTSFESILLNNSIIPLTTCIRTKLLKDISKNQPKKIYKMDDYPVFLEIAKKTKIRRFSKETAVYRVLIESASNSNSLLKRLDFTKSCYKVKYDFIEKYGCSNDLKALIDKEYQKNLIVYAFFIDDKDIALEAFRIRNTVKDLKFNYKCFYYTCRYKSLHWISVLFRKFIRKTP